tara:strand:+ start:1077 stop:1268 length:192 start_codon:yes stop_codon:yes gene_type:complete
MITEFNRNGKAEARVLRPVMFRRSIGTGAEVSLLQELRLDSEPEAEALFPSISGTGNEAEAEV